MRRGKGIFTELQQSVQAGKFSNAASRQYNYCATKKFLYLEQQLGVTIIIITRRINSLSCTEISSTLFVGGGHLMVVSKSVWWSTYCNVEPAAAGNPTDKEPIHRELGPSLVGECVHIRVCVVVVV